MLQLDDISTADGYTDANTISDQQADLLDISVGVADVYVQLRTYDDERQNLTRFGDEFRLPAPARMLFDGVAGIKVRSAEPGTPASVTATLFQPDDPRPSSATAALQVVTTVGQIGVQHNDVLVGSENTLDLEDSATIAWTVTDDVAHGRVQLTGTVLGAAPTGAAGGDLAGSYPSPTIKASVALTGTPTAPTQAVNDNSTAIATTAYVIGQAGTATPLMDGTAAVGISRLYSRQDHVHPTDTSRAALASPAFTGTPTAPTPATADNSTRIATTAYVQANLAAATVTSVFGRTGAVVATNGDYTAAQVTNAADKSSGTQQTFSAILKGSNYKTPAESVSASGPTLTPNFTAGWWHRANASGSGLVTINAPTNGPTHSSSGSSQESGILVIEIRNASGVAISSAWDAVYSFGSFGSAMPANGQTTIWYFSVAPFVTNAHWLCFAQWTGTSPA